MNYRHAFHAGNHADVLKHAVLLFCLDALKRKPTPFAVLDTHAGVGAYDLSSDEAARSPEWQSGIARLWGQDDLPPLVTRYLAAVHGANPDGVLRTYPGSPALIDDSLRDGDVLDACEFHGDDFASLKSAMRKSANVRLHERDGWQALKALLPPSQKRGLVLIDPPYEELDELALSARAIGEALRRFSHGMYLWWRPLKSQSALAAADAEVVAHGARETLRADLWINTPTPTGKLVGSSVFLINPPFGLTEALREALPALAERLAAGKAGFRISSK